MPFEYVAPPRKKWWTGNSAGGIRVPLGRAGATKLQRAITLNPSLSWTRVGYAYWTLMQIGQLKEALGQLDLALRSDPLSLDVRRAFRALVNLLAGQYHANDRRLSICDGPRS